MDQYKEELKNKIIYRASYRGTKEMDIIMIGFVKTLIEKFNINELKKLNEFVNMDDETLISIKNEESMVNVSDSILLNIIENFRKYNIK
tara:strand:- start:44 stop:310 length:267 start_codon:yes stop_codon:yes gene_type:complete